MIPHHLPMAQQQHQPLHLQQGQQGQQGDHHMGVPFERRAWLQAQQQMMMHNQVQNGSDMPNSQVSQQMAELMRNNNMNRPQNQQNFGFPMGLNHNQPPFLDQQNQANTQNRMSPLGFQNGMGSLGTMGGQNQAGYNASLNNRNMMLQALSRDQNNNRQLELMNLAQNQQNQNGPINLANRLGAPGMPSHQPGAFGNTVQSGMNQPGGNAQGDLFPGAVEGIRRPSPHPQGQTAQQSSPPGGGLAFGTLPQQSMNPALNPGPNVNARRPITLPDLQDRQNTMKAQVAQVEMQMRALLGQRSSLPEPAFASKMRTYQADVNRQKDALNRVTLLINQMTSQGLTQMPFPNSSMGGSPAVQGGQPQQPPWMQQNHSMPQNPPFGTPASTNSAQANGHTSPPPGHVPPPINGVPRPGGQPSHTSNPNSFSPANQGGGNPAGFNGNTSTPSGIGMPANPAALAATLSQSPQPLAKEKFALTYKSWCAKNNVTHDQRLLSIDNLNIDLYTLHVEVLKEGGMTAVQSKDLWSVIAGRMGCVQFPGTLTDPPKSGPAAANQLAHVYKEYLADFDRFYWANFRLRMMLNQISANQLFRGMELTKVLQLVNTPVAELQGRGIPAEVIRLIEVTRPALHTLMSDQSLLQNVLKHRAQNAAGNGNAALDAAGHFGFNNAGGQIRPMGNLGPNATPGNTHMYPQKQDLMNPITGTPNPLRIQAATNEIQMMKQEVQHKLQGITPAAEVPDVDRLEYNNLLEAAFRNASTMERELPFFHMIVTGRQPDTGIQHTRKLVAYVVNIQHQRQMIGFTQPRFIMTMQELKTAQEFIQKSHEFVANQAKVMSGQRPDAPRLPTQPVNTSPMPQHPSSPNAPPQTSPLLLSRPAVNLTLPPGHKKKGSQVTPQLSAASPPNHGVVASVNTPTPPANPSTPAANAVTPVASSPQTPKSPKSKAPPKPRATTKRKNSTTTANRANTTPTATPVTEPAVVPRNSTPVNSLKRKLEDEEPSLTAVATPPAPTSSSAGTSTSQGAPAANEPSPPKKVKTEWDAPPSEELRRKEEVVENIKTEEDASAFLEQMTQLIQMSTAEDGGSALSQDISDTLDMILKGCSTIPDGDNGMTSLLSDLSSGSTSEPAKDEFVEFFDFSSFAAHEDDDPSSKANTPDLIPSSSTNPSPESGSDTDPVHHTSLLPESKFEEYSDPLRLGTLKEIDGGESTYYHSNEWKWDTPMSTLDQPWAVFNS